MIHDKSSCASLETRQKYNGHTLETGWRKSLFSNELDIESKAISIRFMDNGTELANFRSYSVNRGELFNEMNYGFRTWNSFLIPGLLKLWFDKKWNQNLCFLRYANPNYSSVYIKHCLHKLITHRIHFDKIEKSQS